MKNEDIIILKDVSDILTEHTAESETTCPACEAGAEITAICEDYEKSYKYNSAESGKCKSCWDNYCTAMDELAEYMNSYDD